MATSPQIHELDCCELEHVIGFNGAHKVKTGAMQVWVLVCARVIACVQGCLNTHPTEANVIIYPVGKVRACVHARARARI